jgi:osmoprotectant transport system ATP-binding protein
LIQFDAVTKSFAGTRAVDDLSLTVASGERVALIGPSGCGKSTLLSLLVGQVVPDAGRVLLDDIELSRDTVIAARRRMGYMIQDGGLFPHLTARENVTLMARELGWTAARRAERLAGLAALTRLPAALLDRYPAELSGGQRQRVSLMRALMLDPDPIILDEPLGALDPLIRADLQDELRDIFAQLGKTVLLVTHDLAEAAFLAERIVLMNQGRIVQSGSFADLVERPADPFVTRFVRAQDRRLAAGASS